MASEPSVAEYIAFVEDRLRALNAEEAAFGELRTVAERFRAAPPPVS